MWVHLAKLERQGHKRNSNGSAAVPHKHSHPIGTAGDRVARFGGAAAVELHRAVADAVAVGRFRQPPIQIGSQLSLSDDRCVLLWSSWVCVCAPAVW